MKKPAYEKCTEKVSNDRVIFVRLRKVAEDSHGVDDSRSGFAPFCSIRG